MEFTKMMVLPIALISFLPFSAELRAESSNTAYIIQQSKKTVTGVVVDMAGLPLIGVNVSIKEVRRKELLQIWMVNSI